MSTKGVQLTLEEATDTLKVLAGFQGLLLAEIVTGEMLKGSAFRDLGIDRGDPSAGAALADVIENVLEAFRREGV